jgi:hypothetical protein
MTQFPDFEKSILHQTDAPSVLIQKRVELGRKDKTIPRHTTEVNKTIWCCTPMLHGKEEKVPRRLYFPLQTYKGFKLRLVQV